MGILFSNPDGNSGAQNNLLKKQKMSAMQKRTIKNPDGTVNVKGKSIIHSDTKLMEGDRWLHNPLLWLSVEDQDSSDLHFRRDEKITEIKEFESFIDKDGREITDEKQVVIEDVFETKGVKLIGNSPALHIDDRKKLLSEFAKNDTDPFGILRTDQRKKLLENLGDNNA